MKINKIFFLVLFAFILGCNGNSGKFEFSPEMCEFSITFPTKFSAVSIAADNETGMAAKASPNKNTSLGSECWPFDPSIISIDLYAKNIKSEIASRGFMANSIIVERDHKVAPRVIATASTKIDGQIYTLKMLSYLGNHSRFDVLVVDKGIASDIQIKFRNSVKRVR